jgi:hypothetical protein
MIENTTLTNVTANNNTVNGIYAQNTTGGTINKLMIKGATTNSNIQNGILLFQTSTGTAFGQTSVSLSTATGNGLNGIFLQNANLAGVYSVDLGGGAMNSVGQNRFFDNVSKDIRVSFPAGATPVVFAKNNWWGTASGLLAARYTVTNATIDSSAFLTTDPRP